MVNGEQLRSQRMIGLPFTVHCLPNALRYALSALLHGVSSRLGPLDLDFYLNYFAINCF
jgi:hypothetical protein